MTPWEICPNCGELRQLDRKYCPTNPLCYMCNQEIGKHVKEGQCEICKQPRRLAKSWQAWRCMDCIETLIQVVEPRFYVPHYLLADFDTAIKAYAAQWVAEHTRVKV